MRLNKLLTTITLSLILIFTFALPTLASKTLPTQTNITVDKEWKIKFSQPVNSSTLQSNIILNNSNGTSFSIQPSVDPNDSKVVLIKHSTPFANGENYTLSVNSGVKSLTGNSLSDSTTMSFSTIAAPLPTISSIVDITQTIVQDDTYSLPSTVEATMSDGSKKQVAVTWNPLTVDTSKSGTYTFQGDIDGYSKKVNLFIDIMDLANVNKKGNTISNLNSGGFVATQGDWVYYNDTSVLDSWSGLSGHLHKIRIDGSGEQQLGNDWMRSINVVGHRIYYLSMSSIDANGNVVYGYDNGNGNSYGIWSMNLDGQDKQIISKDLPDGLILVVENKIYYILKGSLVSINVDGTNKTKITSVSDIYVTSFDIEENNILLVDLSKRIYKCTLDGTNLVKLASGYNIHEPTVANGVIYYTDSTSFMALNIQNNQVSKIANVYARHINLLGDTIYYSDGYDDLLHKIRADGTQKTDLMPDERAFIKYFNIQGDWIYYFEEISATLFKIKIDGTQKTKVYSRAI